MWFPHKTPSLSSFKGCLLDFERILGLRGSEHGYCLDSVPVGDPQTAGTSENLLLWLQKTKTSTLPQIYAVTGGCARGKTGRRCKITMSLTVWCSVRRPIPEVPFASSAMEQTRPVFRYAEPLGTVHTIPILCTIQPISTRLSDIDQRSWANNEGGY